MTSPSGEMLGPSRLAPLRWLPPLATRSYERLRAKASKRRRCPQEIAASSLRPLTLAAGTAVHRPATLPHGPPASGHANSHGTLQRRVAHALRMMPRPLLVCRKRRYMKRLVWTSFLSVVLLTPSPVWASCWVCVGVPIQHYGTCRQAGIWEEGELNCEDPCPIPYTIDCMNAPAAVTYRSLGSPEASSVSTEGSNASAATGSSD